MNQSLKVRIISPKQLIFEGSVYSVSSINSVGRFDILPSHANFITFVENQTISLKKTSGEITQFKFPLAIIYSQRDNVNIYTEIQQISI